ncbi:Rho termination factor N-terminal domain-containing protein [Ancylobacter sp. FA202]|uniref:Rho termination factor N-terminal domain-containing protein n=1 Tax=Ancylobacter sp. FA202 TaxID=1111106 RepID=UPI000364AAAB|nr:Rho termination factor N-terminal domain-containing protein [Ancylobacter sp. FA202]
MLKVIAEFVDKRNGRRYLPGAEIDPPLDQDQIDRLMKAGCLAGVELDLSALRQDGPTVGEFVAAGYKAANYPPRGYVSRSTPEEIAAAVAAETAGPGLDTMTVAELRKHAEANGIEIAADITKKADIVAAIELALAGE